MTKGLLQKSWMLLAMSIVAFVPVSAVAQDVSVRPQAVVELFTSQGCSSCPPADALLADLDQRDDVLALAYHVDYWDYIGWKDTFAAPAFSAYQRAYARCWNKDRVYTPQMVINGTSGVVGSRRNEVEDKLKAASLPVGLEIIYENGALNITIDAGDNLPESTVWLVTFKTHEQIDIGRGENSGRSITYTQIVTERRALGMWDPSMGHHMKLAARDVFDNASDMEGLGAAILVQQDINGLPGPILAAASIEF